MSTNGYWLSRVKPIPYIDYEKIGRIAAGLPYSHHKMLWRLFDLPRRESNGKADFLFRYEVEYEGMPIFYVLSPILPHDKYGVWCIEPKLYRPDIREGDRLAFKLRVNPVVSRRTEGKKNTTHHDIVMDTQKRLLEDLAELARVGGKGKKSEVRKRILLAWAVAEPKDFKKRLIDIIQDNERFRYIALNRMPNETLLDTAIKAATDKALESWLNQRGERKGFALIRRRTSPGIDFRVCSYHFNGLRQKGPTAGYSSVDIEGSLEVTDPSEFREVLLRGLGKAKAFGCGLMLVRRI